MRQEAKEVDGPELEQAEERKRPNELVEEDEEELYDLDGKPELTHDVGESASVIGAMNTILEGEQIIVNDLRLPKRELRALEALKAAVDGRDSELDQFVYAEDRRTLLEQALAVLQPQIADLSQTGGLPFEELLHKVAGVREKLNNLEDAEEEVQRHPEQTKGEEGDTEDKPKPQPGDDDTSLTGEPRKIDKPASSLTGPEVKEAPKPASTLGGPEIKEAAKPQSTLGEPEPKMEGGGPATPEVNEVAKPETTLGDSTEIAETAKKPWWRRPFGG